MRRIAIAIGLCGLLAACGQEAQPTGQGGTAAQLDYIDAVPITEEDRPAPVARPEPAAKKEEPEAEKAAEETDTPARNAPPSAEPAKPAAPSSDAASATRRANEAVAPRSTTEVPYSPN